MQWSGSIFFLVFLFLPTIENAVVNIDGSIDLGPYFQIEYSLAPLSYNYDIDTKKNVQELSKPSRRPAHKDGQRTKKRKQKYLRDDESTTKTIPFETPTTDRMTIIDEETTIDSPKVKATVTEIPETEETLPEIPETEATVPEIPETEATVAEIPETEATVAEIPETEATVAEIPETESPETEIPETEIPEAEIPETESPETEIPETEIPETEIPETIIPETEISETEISETDIPETEIPETEATVTEIPKTKATSNAGSTLVSTSAFKLPQKNTTQPEWIKNWFTRRTIPRTTRLFDVTKYYAINAAVDTNIFDENHKVKDVAIIKDFSIHILRQTLQVFETIKSKVDDPNIKRKVDFLSRNYKNKFIEFVRETQDHNVRTRLGTQKVVLNTIETSNRILRRLVNYFIGNIHKNPTLSDEGIDNVVEAEVRKEIDLEYQHACKKFGICRNAVGFQQFLLDVINEILKNNDKKLRDVNDALTEVLKETDLSKIVDSELQKKIDKVIRGLESTETRFLKPTYTMWRNALGLRNKPITVMEGALGASVNKTVAFLDIIDTLDSNIKPTEKNVMVWNRIKHNLSEWTAGMRKESYPIMKMFLKHIMDEINKFDLDTAVTINEKLKVMTMDVERLGYDYE